MMKRLERLSLAVCLTALLLAPARADDAAAAPADLAFREEAAFRAAAAAVAPAVVSIETIGGLDTLGEDAVGTGPSSGLVVTPDGYIVSSTFNFAHKPASIIVSLADGRRLPARLVARDQVRKLVLLKVEGVSGLAVPQAAPQSECVVGVWSIAVGRTYEPRQTNMSVGIISAVNRIWGKALQTDAKVSPANYGGPLVDIRGRVMGVLVPLSPTETDDVAGAEWYDSGIGFAVPLEHILKVLPRLQKGEDLKVGLLGIRFRGPNVYADPPLLAHARANSPAYEAGLRKGDLITAIDGKPVALQVQVSEAIQSRYAGDVLKLSIKRGETETFERELKLAEKLEPYKRPFLGFLPERVAAKDGDGVGVRYVFADSPAAEKQLKSGDRITAVGGVEVKDRDRLALAVAEAEPGKKIALTVKRGAEELKLELTPGAQPETVPEKLGAANDSPQAKKVEPVALKVAEFGNDCALYVPDNYSDDVPHGLVLLLHPMGGFEKQRLKLLIDSWLPICERDHLLLAVPRAAHREGAWAADDLSYLGKLINLIATDRYLDPRRIVAHGFEEGGVVAWRAAVRYPERIAGVALVNSGFSGPMPENEPATPLAIYVATEKDFPNAGRLKVAIEALRERFFPVTSRSLPAGADDLDAAQLDELARWIDMLDRI